MTELTKMVHGPYSIYFAGEAVDPRLLIDRLGEARIINGKGREGIKLVQVTTAVTLACRKYVHGGLLRALTGERFLTSRRALSELATTRYLVENYFPVVSPYCIVIENHFLTKRLYLFTYFEENSIDLLEYLRTSNKMTRFRAIRRLAELLRSLETLEVYHPDLHLNNVLITREHKMVLLDFDRSRIGHTTKKDMIRMFWRLNRFVEKMEKQGSISFSLKEKELFLRIYARLSGYDVVTAMKKKARTKRLTNRLGWLIERVFYGRTK